MSDTTEGDWVPGLKCTKCSGTVENDDAKTCLACAGTGDVWLTYKQRAEAAEARVKELEKRDVEKLATWLTPAGVEKTKERLDDGTVGEVLFIASILRSMAEDTEVEANDLLADGSVYGAEDAQGRVDMYWHMHEAICEISESGRTKAEARVRELEAALRELKRNTVEVILPNAKSIMLDQGQIALWGACIKQVDKALAETKDAQ